VALVVVTVELVVQLKLVLLEPLTKVLQVEPMCVVQILTRCQQVVVVPEA
jgi:hypothetical protein